MPTGNKEGVGLLKKFVYDHVRETLAHGYLA